VVISPTNGVDCTDVSIQSVADSQFNERKVISFSSGFITKDEGRNSQVRFIKNQNQVVVGEMIADGMYGETSLCSLQILMPPLDSQLLYL